MSSFEKWPSGPYGGSSWSRWFRPFSSMITDHPAAVSTSATVAPAGPVPTITASQSRSATVRHLVVGPPAGLDVTGEPDGGPSLAVPVAAVDRVPVQRLAGVLEHLVAEGLVAPVEPALL